MFFLRKYFKMLEGPLVYAQQLYCSLTVKPEYEIRYEYDTAPIRRYGKISKIMGYVNKKII